jgi:type VI secretion system protein ImpH
MARQSSRFDFFQAVRLLERHARRSRRREGSVAVGEDVAPAHEAVRFTSCPSLGFAAAPVQSVKLPPEQTPDAPAEMAVTFMGLTGPSGALPHHYTATAIAQERTRERSLRGFFDLFHHRLVSLFYRAWEKYRLPIAFERNLFASGGSDREESPWAGRDPFTSALLCLAGLGNPGEQERLSVRDEVLVFFAGQIARRPRSAASLEAILGESFGVRAKVEQFRGHWLALETSERSRLGKSGGGGYCALGQSLVLGGKVWDVQSGFRIRLGPLTYEKFCDLLPGSDRLRQVGDLARYYVGAEFDFDVQLELDPRERPRSRLGRGAGGGRLGANVWLSSGPAKVDSVKRAFRVKTL